MNKEENNDQLVLCATFDNERVAYIAKGVLKNEGIESVVDNALFSSLLPVGIPSISGVRLMVLSSDLTQALQILEASGLTK